MTQTSNKKRHLTKEQEERFLDTLRRLADENQKAGMDFESGLRAALNRFNKEYPEVLAAFTLDWLKEGKE